MKYNRIFYNIGCGPIGPMGPEVELTHPHRAASDWEAGLVGESTAVRVPSGGQDLLGWDLNAGPIPHLQPLFRPMGGPFCLANARCP